MRWRSTSAAATARAQKSAQRALAIQAETPELAQDNEFTVLGHLLAAGSAHRLQDRAARDEELRRALELARRSPAARSAEEGARLLAAEWALDDRDAPRAIELLDELPLGVARRTHALRLKLQAARLGAPAAGGAEDGAPAGQAPGLLDGRRARPAALAGVRVARHRARRRPAAPALAAASIRPTGAIRSSPRAPRRGRARSARRGARAWLRPFWDRIAELGAEERAAVAEALAGAVRRHRRRMAAAPRVGRRRRCRATARSRWPPAARSPSAGSGARRARCSSRPRGDAALAARGAPQGLDRARRAGRAGGRRGRAARCYESAARLG